MDSLDELLIPIAFFAVVAIIIKVIADTRTRNKLIDKGLVDEKAKYIFSHYHDARYRALSNLKWGMVLVGIGVAAMLGFWFPRTINEEGVIGLMFIFAGLGFLISYFVFPKNGNGKDSDQV